jgi:glyoxylase I family protein
VATSHLGPNDLGESVSTESQSETGFRPLSHWISAMPYHIGIEVPDLDEGLRFYRDILGFEEAWRYYSDGPFMESLIGISGVSVTTVQLLVPGGSRVELQEYRPQGNVGENRVTNQGLNHLCFGVVDVDAAYESLSAAGVEFTSEPIRIDDPNNPAYGWCVAYFIDPWGTVLEMLGPVAPGTVDTGEIPAKAG